MTNSEFDGETFDSVLDGNRLADQLRLVKHFMSDSKWRTLSDITNATGAPNASASARLRDLRKHRFGGHTVERRRVGLGRSGLFEYRVIPNNEQA